MQDGSTPQKHIEALITFWRDRLAKQESIVEARATAHLIKQLIALHRRLDNVEFKDLLGETWLGRLTDTESAKQGSQIIALINDVLDLDTKIGALLIADAIRQANCGHKLPSELLREQSATRLSSQG